MSLNTRTDFKKTKLSADKEYSIIPSADCPEPIVSLRAPASVGRVASSLESFAPAAVGPKIDVRKSRFSRKKWVVISALVGAALGFSVQLTIDFVLVHFFLPPTNTPSGMVVQGSQVTRFFKRPFKEFEQFTQQNPRWVALDHQALFFALLLERGESAVRSAIIMAFLTASAVLVLEPSRRHRSLKLRVKD